MKRILSVLIICLVAMSATQCVSSSVESKEQSAPPKTAGAFVSEYLRTLLLPTPYTIDDSPDGVYGLNGGTWYVDGEHGNDSNAGNSTGQAFQTIQKGIDASKPGDKIYVMDGTYRNGHSLVYSHVGDFYKHSGTTAHWILLANYPGQHPKIEFTASDAIEIDGCSYIIISGFTIQGNSNSITLEEAQAKENTIDDSMVYLTGCGIFATPQFDNVSVLPHHLVFANNVIYKCPGSGIATSGADYLTIRSNIVAYNGFYSPYAQSGMEISQNVDSNPGDTGLRNLISENLYFGNCDYIPFIKDRERPKNITDGNGVIIDDFDHIENIGLGAGIPPYAGKTLIQNNICFDNGARGICINQSRQVTVKNNTCYLNAKHTTYKNDADILITRSRDISVINNIAVSRHSVDSGRSAVLVFDSRSGVSFINNLFSGGGINPPIIKGSNLIDVDPLFVSASTEPTAADFSLKRGSPALDKCANDIDIDFFGHPRPSGRSVDMGALEQK